jgi:hypothetical protein
MTQPDLGFGAPRRRKAGRVPVTSAVAYQAAHPQTRMTKVLSMLTFVDAPVTSAELSSRFSGWQWPTMEYTLYVRRGLSDALSAGLVEHAGKRLCAVSGTLALTWRVVSR